MRSPAFDHAVRPLLIMLLASGLGLASACGSHQGSGTTPATPMAGQDVRTSKGESLSPPEEGSEALAPIEIEQDEIEASQGSQDAEESGWEEEEDEEYGEEDEEL